MSEIIINAEVRKDTGRKVRAMRRSGKIPGIYYRHGLQNINIAIQDLKLRPLYTTSETHVINLKLDDGSAHMCVLRDIQLDPVTEKPVHFDLLGLNENEEISLDVPVKLTGGIPKGVREGGILQHILHKLKISCLPKNIPAHIEINVENLEINKSVHVKNISLPDVKILDNATSTIVAVVPPLVVKEAEATAAAVPTAEAKAEPEVISKGKKVEEGAESPEKKADDKKK